MKLTEFYSELLKLALCDVDDGVVKTKGSGKLAVIGTGRLVLPTHENLKNRANERLAVFNPLKEDFKKIDAVTSEYQHLAAVFINARLTEVMTTLLKLLNRRDLHAKLITEEQMTLLELGVDVEEKSLDNYEKMIGMLFSKNDKPFLSLYIKNGGKVEEKTYVKACITTSSFSDNLDNYKTFGIRKLDKELFLKLFNYIIEYDSHKYDTGSDLNIAPGFFSLMKTIGKIHQRLNYLNELFSDFITENSENVDRVVDVSVIQSIDNFNEFANEVRGIPVQINEADIIPQTVVEPVIDNNINIPMSLNFIDTNPASLEDEIKNVIRSGNKQLATKPLPTKKNMNNNLYSNGQPVMFDLNGNPIPEQEVYPQAVVPTTYPSGRPVRLYQDGSMVPENIAYPNTPQQQMVQQPTQFYNQQQQPRGNIPTPNYGGQRNYNARMAGAHNNALVNFQQNNLARAPVGINVGVCFSLKRTVYYPDGTIPDVDNNGFIIPNVNYPLGTPLWWGQNEPGMIDNFGNLLPPQQQQMMQQQMRYPVQQQNQFSGGVNTGLSNLNSGFGSFGNNMNNGGVMNSVGNGNIPNNPLDFRAENR